VKHLGTGEGSSIDVMKNWSKLSPLQVGRYAEQLVALELTGSACQVFSSEVDDRGIDFVVRTETGKYYDLQVKSARLNKTKYIFFPKDKFQLRPNLWAAVVLLVDDELPRIFLFPSEVWMRPNVLFSDRSYAGKKSKPEWGLSLSNKHREALDKFSFGKMVHSLL